MEPDLHQSPEPQLLAAAASLFAWAQQQLPSSTLQAPPEHLQLQREVQILEDELAKAKGELENIHALLEEIPEIFERKFQQRLQPLLAENHTMRNQLQQGQAFSREATLPKAW